MNIEGWTCRGCGRPVFYDWATNVGDSRDDFYWHVICFYLGDRIETPCEPSTTRQLSLFGEEATS
jgi:hypothetical protein